MRFNSIFQRLLILNLLYLLTACGSFKVREKDEKSVNEVKKIAFVAFKIQEPVPAELGINLGSGSLGASNSAQLIPAYSPYAEDLYKKIQNQFKLRLKFQTLDSEKMLQSEAYKAAFKKTMEGWQNKMPPGQGQRYVLIRNIMDDDAVRIMGKEGRDQLIKDLNVDAIVVASANYSLAGTTIMGIGERYPQLILSYKVYKAGQEMPIWFDSVKSEPAIESVGKTSFFDEQKFKKVALDVAEITVKKIQ